MNLSHSFGYYSLIISDRYIIWFSLIIFKVNGIRGIYAISHINFVGQKCQVVIMLHECHVFL